MANPPPLNQQELCDYFPALRRQPIKPGAFEIGLCLGGTVAAGAYTGGVLDCLIEVLDTWTRAKNAGSSDAPPHEVVISNIAGTSGGAINGAILLRAAGWEFNHGADDANPFYAGGPKASI
jgi:predicted acylesterase/phospholipase RssA